MKRIHSYFVCVLLLTAILAGTSFAQVATGIPPFSSIGGGPFDQLNLGNLNVHLDIPIIHKAGRGMPFTYDVTYDNSVWVATASGGHTVWQPSATHGWQGLTQTGFANVNYSTSYSSGTCGQYGTGTWQSWTYSNFSYSDALGVTHPIPFGASYIQNNGVTNCPPAGPQPASATITIPDGSGYTLIASPNAGSVTTYIGTGAGVTLQPTVKFDANGNEITNNGNTYTDTLGQTALTVAGNGTPSSPITLTYTGPSGAVAYTAKYTATAVTTSFGCTNISEYSGTLNLVTQISLPDQSAYTFSYYSDGRLETVTLPTGGTITYAYTGANKGINCADGTTIGLTRTLSPGGQWTYTRTDISGNHWQTKATTPPDPSVGNDTVIDFEKDSASTSTNNFYETQRVAYQGSAPTTPLSTTINCYNAPSGTTPTPSTCPAASVSTPLLRITAFHYLPNTSGMESETDSTYDNFGLIHEVDSYDYGSGTVGPRLQKILTNYATLGNGIVDRPSGVTTTDGSGSIKAFTSYSYDGTAVTTTSGTPQHVSVSGSRGNLTSASVDANSSTILYRTFSYYDTGVLNTSTGASTSSISPGPSTTYVYGTGSCGNSFPTQVNMPLSLSTSATWNCVGGVQLTSIDMNGNTTTTAYTDPYFWRPASVTYPDGGLTSFTYNSENETTTSQKINSTANLVSATILDGFGRAIQQQRTSDPLGVVKTDTTYDAINRIASVSNPYVTTSDPTYGVTQFNYDALGRKIKITHPDSSYKAFTYTKRATQVQDEGNGTSRVTKVSQRDGLGRLASVCEVTSASQMGNGSTPAACGQDITATGFLTNYTYDALSNVLTVSQNGLNGRTYTYDMLSRLASEINPETNNGATTNTISYTYDSCSAGDLCSRTAPKPNQTGSAQVVTSYSYDALHRITQTSYNDGVTPSVFRSYDTCCWWTGYSQTNTKGRLQEEWVGTSCCGSEAQIFGYDAMGRVALNVQCTPLNCGSPNIAFNYTYDFAGDMTSSTNGYNGTYTYTYDTAERLTGITSSIVDSTHPGSLLSNVQYNPLEEETAATMGNGTSGAGITESRGYDVRGRENSLSSGVIGGPGIYNMSGVSYAPNSNLLGVSDSILAGTWTYTYDDFNRLASTSATGSDWGTVSDTYKYDRFGNRWQQNVGGTGNPSYVFDSNNHISGSGFTYDAAGNVINDGFNSYTYDPEGRMLTVNSGSTVIATSAYDASGRRIQKTVGSNTTYLAYDLMGHDWFAYGSSGNAANLEVYQPNNGRHLVTYSDNFTFFDFQDQVDSERVKITQDGLHAESTANLPFGDGQMNWGSFGGDPGPAHFTGFDADTETGASNLSHAWFRQYSATQGRWMMPDPAGMAAADPTTPQSWNRYAYVMNSPLNNVDPFGLDFCSPDDPTGCCNPLNDPTQCGSYCPPEYGYCGVGVCNYDPDFCIPDGGGGGGGEGGGNPSPAPPSAPAPTPTGGVWLNNETLGLPGGLNVHPLSLGDFFGLTPGCEFGVCAPIGGNNFAVALAAGGLGEGVCVIVEPCGLAEVAVLGLGTVAVVYGPEIVNGVKQLSKGGKQNIVPSWAEGAQPLPGESASQFADRLCEQQYPPNGAGCGSGPGSERSKIQKWARDKWGI